MQLSRGIKSILTYLLTYLEPEEVSLTGQFTYRQATGRLV